MSKVREAVLGEIVKGSELVDGDYILGMASMSGFVGYYVKKMTDGRMGYVDKSDGVIKAHEYLCEDYLFRVRTPRPAPEVNEWGLVSP